MTWTIIACLVLALLPTWPASATPIPGAGPQDRTPTGVSGGDGAAIAPVPGRVVRTYEQPIGPYGPGHRGVDLAASPGEVVLAALPGTVSFSGEVAGTGWVTVAHGGGLATTYGPLSGRVAQGRVVARGQVIGRLTHGTHLDWGARDDDGYLDPLLLLQRWRLRLTVPAGPSAGQDLPP